MKKQFSRIIKDEKGVALFTAVFSILLVTILGLSLMFISESSRTVSNNNIESTEVFYIAEAGLAHAVGLIKANGSTFNINSVIPSSGTGVTFGKGSYTVQITSPTTNTRQITAIGVGRNGATATVQAIYQVTFPNTTNGGIVVNGDINISGNIEITGSNGIIHSNGNMVLSGNNRAELHYSATGTLTAPTAQPCPNGSVSGAPPTCDATVDMRSGQSAISVPNIQPSSFISQADYFLVPPNPATMPAPLSAISTPNQATIYDKNGNVMGTSCAAGCWGGWTYNASQGFVINSGSTLPAGTYYGYQSSIQVNKTFGTSASPLSISFIADGHLGFSSGNSYFNSKASLSGDKYAVVAGGDVVISGANLINTEKNNIFYARHQFSLEGGQPVINGRILVYNETDGILFNANPKPRVNGSSFLTTGDPKVYSETSSSSSGSTTVTLISWKEVRN
jgi:Tfp pilus assembly protein PilX